MIDTAPAHPDTPRKRRPRAGLSLMHEPAFRAAALPLFEAVVVEVLEYSFDMGWGPDAPPPWVEPLVDHYGEHDRLLGHGVTYSPLSARWTPRHQWWLDRLADECRRRRYTHVTEHFGFMAAGAFHQGAPLPVPLTEASLRIGRDRLKRLADVAGRPVGLENLAFAFCADDVARQGEFLDRLLDPVGGFLLLDLHNVYCQSCNFDADAAALLDAMPLHRVRELHLSGGSWSEPSDAADASAAVRRDTHDGPVPDAVFDLLRIALRRCPGVEAVILEQIGEALAGANEAARFADDFHRMSRTIDEATNDLR